VKEGSSFAAGSASGYARTNLTRSTRESGAALQFENCHVLAVAGGRGAVAAFLRRGLSFDDLRAAIPRMLDTAIAEQLNLIVRPAPCHMVGMKAGTRRCRPS
jgi:hypothetical protein